MKKLLADKRVVNVEAGFWYLHGRDDNRSVAIGEAVLEHRLIAGRARNQSIMLIEILEDDGLVDGQLCIDDRIETASRSAEAVDDSLCEGTCGVS